jgi:hypothetical protein
MEALVIEYMDLARGIDNTEGSPAALHLAGLPGGRQFDYLAKNLIAHGI